MVISHYKVKKHFVYMWLVKKYVRLSIYKLILYFLGLLKKIESHLSYAKSFRVCIDLTCYLN